jgi:hypothetical protein
MPIAIDDVTASLHYANSRLVFWIDSLLPPGSNEPLPATPEQMSGLMSLLIQVGERLRNLPQNQNNKDSQLEHEVGDYRRNVERLRMVLPSIHNSLLRERARLEQERLRVESAAEWVRCSRETL